MRSTGQGLTFTKFLYWGQIFVTKSDCIYAKNVSALSITHLFFAKKTLKVPLCEKTNAIGETEYPKTAGNYGTLLISQLAGLWQSVVSTRT